ncbi:CBM96 family carbohydrate-binding protein [Melittangium boletus]|uniref:CBM96 family carbohydrate-binding protein n=1 Tax=Melittangium boletus TaxID=83453 RepID=UPI003DA64665
MEWLKKGLRGLGAGVAVVVLSHGDAAASTEMPARGGAVQRTWTVTTEGDAHVDQGQPAQNFGDSATLFVSSSPRRDAYLRFTIEGLRGEVTSAKLRLYATSPTDNGPRLTSLLAYWNELGVTWNASPGLHGEVLADLGAVAQDTWVEYDVTPSIVGSGTYMFGLLGDSIHVAAFASKEDPRAERRPQLVITTAPLTDCMPRTSTRSVSTGYMTRTAYASENRPGAWAGAYGPFRVKGAPDRMESYFKLAYPGTQRWTPRSITLRLFATSGTQDGPALHPVSTAWSRNAYGVEDVNWYSRPTLLGPAVDNLGAIASGSWVEYDLTRAGLHAYQEYAFGLLPESSDEVRFVTNASGEPAPELHLTLESDEYCTYRGTGGGRLGWVKQHGGRQDERLYLMATDVRGGFVATGHFGDSPLVRPGDVVLARFDAEGDLSWTRRLATDSVQARALTVAPDGGIFLVGNYQGTLDLGTGPLPRSPSLNQGFFVARFFPDGRTEWSQGFVLTPTDPRDHPYLTVRPIEAASEPSGGLFVVGALSGTLDLSGPAGSAAPHDVRNGGFVVRLDAQGRPVWSRSISGDSYTSAWVQSVSTDSEGGVVLTGEMGSDSDLGDGQTTGQERASFIARYSPEGDLLWKRVFHFDRGSIRSARFVGDQGQVGFVASIGGPFSFAGESYVGGMPGGTEPANVWSFLGTLDAKGRDGWIREQGYFAGELLAGRDGTLTVTDLSQTWNLGGGLLDPVTGGPRLARYSATGTHLWSRALDVSLYDPYGTQLPPDWTPPRLALLPGGGLLVGGVFARPLQLDGRSFSSRGAADLLFFQLDP